MSLTSKLGKLFLAAFGGFVDVRCLVLQPSVEVELERPPPVAVTVDRGALVVSPWITSRNLDSDSSNHHPKNTKNSYKNDDGSWTGGHMGDHSNILQFIMNAVIYAETEDIAEVRLQDDVHHFLKNGMMPGLPNVIEIDRKEGRMDKNPVSSSCGTCSWTACRVNISARAKVAEYYFKRYMPTDCGDPRYEGLVIHLRRPEYKLSDYMQPPCDLYRFVIEEGKYTSIRVFGENQNPCGDWLKNYSKDHGIDLDYQVGRSFQLDFCEGARAKNFVMGISTMSQNAILLGGRKGRHLYQMLPPVVGDPFTYFGQGTGYIKQLCDVFEVTGLTLDDSSYWDMNLNMESKMLSKTLGVKAVPCESSTTRK